jgi:glycosyltransferase involved in cell wall biosynthesis
MPYVKALHLVGFMNNDEYSFLKDNTIIGRSIDQKLLESFTLGHLSDNRQTPAIAFSSKFDRDRLKKFLPLKNSLYVGIGFDKKTINRSSQKNSAIFVGNKTTLNKLAVEYLVEKIWPLVVLQVPNARLRIVGRVCGYFSELYDSVDFVGEVEDLNAEYSDAKLVVAPLLIGSGGVKTKVAEALAYGRVVVTTSLGVDSSDPNQLQGAAFIADDPVKFSEHVGQLLTDDELRNRMETKTSEVFESNYSVEAAYKEIDDWLNLV